MDKQVAYLDGEGFVHRATLQSIEPGGWTADDLHENDGQNASPNGKGVNGIEAEAAGLPIADRRGATSAGSLYAVRI